MDDNRNSVRTRFQHYEYAILQDSCHGNPSKYMTVISGGAVLYRSTPMGLDSLEAFEKKMNLRELFSLYLDSNSNPELREAVFWRTVSLILEAKGFGHLTDIRSAPWDDPNLSPLEDAPYIVLDRLDAWRKKGLLALPVAPQTVVLQAMADSARKCRAEKNLRALTPIGDEGRVDPFSEAALKLVDSAFHDVDKRALFETFLSTLTCYIDTFREEDRFIAWFALPRVHSGFATLVISYNIRSLEEIAESIGRPTSDVIRLIAMDGSLITYLASELDRPEKTVAHRSRRIAKALQLVAHQLPYVVELCRMFRS